MENNAEVHRSAHPNSVISSMVSGVESVSSEELMNKIPRQAESLPETQRSA